MAALGRNGTSKVWDYFEVVEKVLCEGVNLAYAGGTTNLHNHLESKHPSSVAESSGKEAGQKQLTLSDSKKCPPERAKNITAHVAE